ncbi:hypothetical protein UFB30_13420 [Jeotgalibacillus sp. HH7-29]|uniref:Uncharacterized protein n=1 Tax=Jeotgalibacillus haloalkalitolerans TaxID=3104292 RepID=A0ABU5KPP8_9BACL|nr:hypothetical protein [Jeotgalibacillus sp. HH7-29]
MAGSSPKPFPFIFCSFLENPVLGEKIYLKYSLYKSWLLISASGGRFPRPGGEPAGFAKSLTCPFLRAAPFHSNHQLCRNNMDFNKA